MIPAECQSNRGLNNALHCLMDAVRKRRIKRAMAVRKILGCRPAAPHSPVKARDLALRASGRLHKAPACLRYREAPQTRATDSRHRLVPQRQQPPIAQDVRLSLHGPCTLPSKETSWFQCRQLPARGHHDTTRELMTPCQPLPLPTS